MIYRKSIFNITIIAETRKDITYVENAILFLKQHDSQWFEKVKKYLKYIAVHPKWSYDNEMLAEIKTWVCQRGTVREASSVYFASLLVHESVHGEFFEKGSKNINSCEEPKAYKTQIEFLKKHKDMHGMSYVTELLKERHWEHNEFVKKENGKIFIKSLVLERYCKKVFEKRKTWK